MKSNLALSAVEQRTLDGNAQSVDLITATGISQIDQSKKPNECNAEFSPWLGVSENWPTLAPSAATFCYVEATKCKTLKDTQDWRSTLKEWQTLEKQVTRMSGAIF